MAALLKVLVVDDAAIYRKIVTELLRGMPDVEVVGTAANGRLALEKIHELRPDLITLDVEMPELDGVQLLRRLRALQLPVGAIMLSAATSRQAATMTEALALGAFDFVVKPSGIDRNANHAQFVDKFMATIQTFAASRHKRLPAVPTETAASDDQGDLPAFTPRSQPEVVCIGISTGGPEALGKMLPQLPHDLSVPVFVVQHMPPLFTKSLADDLNRRCRLAVSEGADGQLVGAGEIVLAPGGRQMKIEKSPQGFIVRLTDDPLENSCRPAVDYLFRSAAEECGSAVLAVIMTGMGSDGTKAIRTLKRLGAAVVAQDEASCVVFGMPMLPIRERLADVVAPLQQIAAHITRLAGRRVLTCR